MDNEKKTRAVIFDLDGTLWDAAETIAPAWNAWCEAHGVERRFTPADCRSCCGKTLPQIARFVFPEADPAWAEWVVNGCCEAECVPLAERAAGSIRICCRCWRSWAGTACWRW